MFISRFKAVLTSEKVHEQEVRLVKTTQTENDMFRLHYYHCYDF